MLQTSKGKLNLLPIASLNLIGLSFSLGGGGGVAAAAAAAAGAAEGS